MKTDSTRLDRVRGHVCLGKTDNTDDVIVSRAMGSPGWGPQDSLCIASRVLSKRDLMQMKRTRCNAFKLLYNIVT